MPFVSISKTALFYCGGREGFSREYSKRAHTYDLAQDIQEQKPDMQFERW